MAKYDHKLENAAIVVQNRQRAEDQVNRLDLDTKGIYFYTPDRTVLTYPELDEEGAVCGRTVVTVVSSDLVTVQKSGFAECKMVFETGKAHLATYDTPLGSMDMIATALEVTPRLGPGGGVLRLHSLLDTSDGIIADNLMEIRVSML